MKPEFSKRKYGEKEGVEIFEYSFSYANSFELSIINYGGIITAIRTPDNKGKMENIVLCLDSLEDYLKDKYNIGALIGRYANRIAYGRFTLNGTEYQLSQNEGYNHLHGGKSGFSHRLWNFTEPTISADSIEFSLELKCRDGEDGFPGNMEIQARFTVYKNGFDLVFESKTDKDTIFSPTQHSYFNLSGNPASKIHDHVLKFGAKGILEVNENLIPTGKILSIENSPFDFNTAKNVNDDFDHCWALDGSDITLKHPESGRKMTIQTEFPGMQVYTSNAFNGEVKGNGGIPFWTNNALCLEPQYYPDSPNHPNFPSVFLEKGKTFKKTSKYRFETITKKL